MSLAFFFLYGQRISWIGLFGILLIFGAVVILGFESSFGGFNILPQDSFNTQMSIVFGLIASLFFAVGTLFFKKVAETFMAEPPGFDFTNMIYDSNLIYGLALMFWMFSIGSDCSFGSVDVLLSAAAFVSINTGELVAGIAVLYGKAGPVSAIGNLKAVFLTAAMALINRETPSALEWLALVLGMIGATIVLMSEKKSEVDKQE